MTWTIACIFIFCADLSIVRAESFCQKPLGVQVGSNPLAQLTASSRHGYKTRADRGRLNTPAKNSDSWGNWCSAGNDAYPWIQANLGSVKAVTGIITQANYGGRRFVKSYKISHSLNEVNFEEIYTENGDYKIFPANSQNNLEVTNNFAFFIAKFVRVHPVTWQGSTEIAGACLRFEILGCCPEYKECHRFLASFVHGACLRDIANVNLTLGLSVVTSKIHCFQFCTSIAQCTAFQLQQTTSNKLICYALGNYSNHLDYHQQIGCAFYRVVT